MNVHILSPYKERIAPIIESAGDIITGIDAADWVVSYGHREIIKDQRIFRRFKDRIINLHISFLPWNRGADPNLWSWFDDTPKGVTIHMMDEGIDTGPIVEQRSLSRFTKHDTLATTYWRLQMELLTMFANKWPCIRAGDFDLIPQSGSGSYHRSKDKADLMLRLSLMHQGFNTPVSKVSAMGKRFRSAQAA